MGHCSDGADAAGSSAVHRLALVCPAADGVQQDVVGTEPERFFRPVYEGRRGWIGLRLDRHRDWTEVAAVVRAAYVQVAPTALVRRLDAP